MEEVRKTFNEIAERYDSQRRKLIPCFDNLYRTLVEVIPFSEERALCFLDLGAGTGLLSQNLCSRYPQAEYFLIDFSSEMLAKAKQRFEGAESIHYLEADYAHSEWPGTFDGIFSSLSIHHLDDEDKKLLYRKILGHLRPGGIFLNAEFVRAESPPLQARYWELWIESMKAAGLTEPELAQALSRTSIDILATVELQLSWLKEMGFQEVACHFRHYLFAVFGGRRA